MTPAPTGYEPTATPRLDGGSQADQDALLKLYYDYWVCNDVFDNEALRQLWSDAPGNVFFNTNGHTYQGLEDWLHIWDHYRSRMILDHPGGTGSIAVTIRGDMALITDSHVPRFWNWVGSPRPPFITDKPYCRATFVCLREPPGSPTPWRTIHVHFSMGRAGPRPDQGGPE